MKIAVVAVTSKGVVLGNRVAELLKLQGHQVDILTLPSLAADIEGVQPLKGSLGEATGELFRKYRGLVMIMALGIVIRIIAPFLDNKQNDPAVVVMDENGGFAISALSGHVGGANDLARQIAEIIGCTPVITTATDVNNVPAIDVLARDYKLNPEPFSAVKKVNAALARGEKIFVYSELELTLPDNPLLQLQKFKKQLPNIEGLRVLVSGRQKLSLGEWDLILRPINLVVGVGCKRGVSSSDILLEIEKALESFDRSRLCLKAVATIQAKVEEKGLIEAALALGVPLLGFTAVELERCIEQYHLQSSKGVMERMGVGGVCEPAAMLACQKGRLLMNKTKGPGITVAITEAESNWWV